MKNKTKIIIGAMVVLSFVTPMAGCSEAPDYTMTVTEQPSGEAIQNVSVHNWVETERSVQIKVTFAFESNGTTIAEVSAYETTPNATGRFAEETDLKGKRSAILGLSTPLKPEDSLVYVIEARNESGDIVDEATVRINRTDT